MYTLLSPTLSWLVLAMTCLLMGLTIAMVRWPWPGLALFMVQVVTAALQIFLLTR